MPNAKAISVAAVSQGSTRSARARKRDGLARSIRGIAGLFVCLFVCFRIALFQSKFVPVQVYSSPNLFQTLPQRDGCGKRADHEAHQGEGAQHAEWRTERNRP